MNNTDQAPIESLLTIAEVAQLLDVDEHVIEDAIGLGALRAVQAGPWATRIRPGHLDKFVTRAVGALVDASAPVAAPEIDADADTDGATPQTVNVFTSPAGDGLNDLAEQLRNYIELVSRRLPTDYQHDLTTETDRRVAAIELAISFRCNLDGPAGCTVNEMVDTAGTIFRFLNGHDTLSVRLDGPHLTHRTPRPAPSTPGAQ